MAKQPLPQTRVARHLREYFGISPKEARKFGREAAKVLSPKKPKK